MTQLITLNLTAEEAITWIKQALTQTGLQVHRSFDLRSSRALATGCLCPHHGTAVCDCQMVVLLLYGSDSRPATLVIHSHNGQTWLTLANSAAERPSPTLISLITQAITAMTAVNVTRHV